VQVDQSESPDRDNVTESPQRQSEYIAEQVDASGEQEAKHSEGMVEVAGEVVLDSNETEIGAEVEKAAEELEAEGGVGETDDDDNGETAKEETLDEKGEDELNEKDEEGALNEKDEDASNEKDGDD